MLPKTDFPMKHKDPVKAELQSRELITTELYRMQWEKNPGEVFVLHDGPPYANGDLHMGEKPCSENYENGSNALVRH